MAKLFLWPLCLQFTLFFLGTLSFWLAPAHPASRFPSVPAQAESLDTQLAEAKSLLRQGLPEDAEHIARQYLANHTDSADAHFLLGEILFREIQTTERNKATSVGTSELHSTVPNSDSNFIAAKAKASLGEFTEGAKYRTPTAFHLKIVALDYVLLGDYPDADKWFTRSLEWNPSDADGWYNLGRTKYNENRFAEAIQAFEHCLQLDPKNVKAEDNLGLSYAGLSRNDDAIAAYKNAIAWQSTLEFKNPGPFIDLGSLYLDLNQSADALPYLSQAIRIAPSDAKAHEQLGKAYSRLNQLPQAQAELEKAVELSPASGSLHFILGQIYRKEGLTEKAQTELDRATVLNGTHSVPETPRP